MSTERVASEYYASSRLAKYPFEPYWPKQKLKICVTGVAFCPYPCTLYDHCLERAARRRGAGWGALRIC